jgi:uncharacterized protein (TIGR02099 family)
MPTPLRRRLRIARRGLWYSVAIGLVLMALVAGVLSQLLPLAERHPDHVAAWLSERVGRTVTFSALETQWTRRGPLLRLDDMRVGEGSNAVLIGDAEMLISQYAGLLPGRSFTELRLHKLDLTVEQDANGLWTVRGLPAEAKQNNNDPFGPLEGLGELQIIDGKLSVVAPELGINTRLPRVDLRLRVDGQRVRIGARAWARAGVSPLLGMIDFNRTLGDGRAYVSASNADLSAWSSLLHVAGVQIIAGSGRADAWAQLRHHRVTTLTVDATLAKLRLRGAPLPSTQPAIASQVELAGVRTQLRWRVIAGGWRVDAPVLRVDSAGSQQQLDGLVLAGGQHFGLLAQHLDAGPVLTIASLSDRMVPSIRRWLLAAKPDAALSNVSIAGSSSGRLRASAHIDALSFASVGSIPGLSGLSGALEGDEQGARLRIDPRKPILASWPLELTGTRELVLDGDIDGWRDAGGWRIATPALHLTSGGIPIGLRGGMRFAGDGRAPRLDLAAELGDFSAPTAKAYWPHHLLPSATVSWLDMALAGGRVHDGRVLISGDLDDWPFIARDGHASSGLFSATADLQDATLKFQERWPALEHADASLLFVGDGFSMAGKGVLAGVGVRQIDAGIAHFVQPELTVHAQGGGDASRLLALLKQSPLHDQYGDTIDNVGGSGLASVTFDLRLPFVQADKTAIAGTVVLANAALSEKRWNLAFDKVRGQATYGSGGFEADKLAVVHAGAPGQLSLRAGSYTRDKRQAFEADLTAVLSADELAAHASELSWLKPYLDGASTWTVGVVVPRSAANTPAQPSQLQLRSNLVGTAITLPAPLRKAAAVPLPASIDAALPLGSGEIHVGLGNIIALRARSSRAANGSNQTGIRVVLGSDSVADPPPASGLIASGHTDTLDALDWIAAAHGDSHGGGASMPLRSIDVSAARLQLFGADFPNTRLQVSPVAGGTSVQLQGAALAGSVRVPDGEGAPVTGRFDHVRWTALPGGAAKNTHAASATDTTDPAKVPPLAIDVADLHVGNAALGTLSLRTQPVAGGMRIQQLQTRSAGQRIDVHGEWIGRANAAHTQLQLVASSEDFGALLGGFGYGGQLAAGHGTATLNAAWPGSPSDFRLDAVTGALHLDMRDGQLVEVEPGAGRVLGLLSLAQLPKRLTLDFHDFFEKGFAFSKVQGDVALGGGKARSDNLLIEGPAAEIHISGAADLVAQQYDQTILVLPRAGNLLTAVGAIAAGPVGAAIGAAANVMLKKPLGRLAAKTYRVTGAWSNPKVEVMSREQSRSDIDATRPPSG